MTDGDHLLLIVLRTTKIQNSLGLIQNFTARGRNVWTLFAVRGTMKLILWYLLYI